MMWQISDSWKGWHDDWYLYDNHHRVGEVVCLERDLGTYSAQLMQRINSKPQYFTDVGKAKDYLWTLYALERAS